MKHDTEDCPSLNYDSHEVWPCPVCIQKGDERESDSQRVEQSPGLVLSPLPPEAAANPAACPYCLILEPEEH